MYRTCIYCNRDLGSNRVVERFAVGRRLAYDPRQGRLWVICERCRRWNLSPMHERWEAIEECERLYHDTPTRYSTDNIGLARTPEGLELVRVGAPLREEFAAWRYGKRFIRRRIRGILKAGAQVAAYATMAYTGVFVVLFPSSDPRRVVARVKDGEGRRLHVTRKDLKRATLSPSRSLTGSGWSLRVPYRLDTTRRWWLWPRGKGPSRTAELGGTAALEAAGTLMARINSFGGSGSQVRDAVRLIEETGSAERMFARASDLAAGLEPLRKMSPEVRLALEMAAHEDLERRALEGELAVLEAAWREAEEIAAIADRLLIPRRIEDFINRQKKRLFDSD